MVSFILAKELMVTKRSFKLYSSFCSFILAKELMVTKQQPHLLIAGATFYSSERIDGNETALDQS